MSRGAQPSWALGLGAACLVALAAFGSLVSTSGLIELIRRDLALTFGQGGFLLSVPFPLIALFAVAGGGLVDRLGVSRMVTLGAALALAGGGARAWSGGFWALAGGTALVGIGTGLIFPALPKLASGTVPPGRRDLASALYTASVVSGAGLGVAVSHLLGFLARFIPLVPGEEGWRGGYFGWALALLAALLLWRALFRGAPGPAEGGAGGAGRLPAASSAFRRPAVWAVALSLFVNNVLFYTSVGWLPAILAGKGWAPAQAAAIVSLVPWLGVVAVLTAHWAAARVGGERVMVLLCALVSAGALAPMDAGSAWTAALGAAALGFSTNFWFLYCLAYPARFAPGERAGQAGGLIIGLGYLGGFAGPWAAGLLRDWAGGFGPALYALAGVALLGIFTVPFFRGREEPA